MHASNLWRLSNVVAVLLPKVAGVSGPAGEKVADISGFYEFRKSEKGTKI